MTIDPDEQTITVLSVLPLNPDSYIDLEFTTDEISQITVQSSDDLTAASEPVIADDHISFHLAIDSASFDDPED